MLTSVFRLLRIVFTVVRFRLDVFIPFGLLPWYVRYTLGAVCAIGRKRAQQNRGELTATGARVSRPYFCEIRTNFIH